jgi:ribosomal protein S18 acetylase RimI-like enzyme
MTIVEFCLHYADLEIVAADPKYQGKGAGSQLMRWGLEQADAQGAEAYLEASPEAVPLYRKLGFEEADKIDTFIKNERVDGVWYRNLFMIRQPAKKTSS